MIVIWRIDIENNTICIENEYLLGGASERGSPKVSQSQSITVDR